MCETFTFYHICGHIQTSKTCRCTTEIHRQITKTEAVTLALLGLPWECSNQHLSESYLNPTSCEDCEKLGMISDWLKCDPGLRLHIIKEWQQRRQAAISEKTGHISDAIGSNSNLDCSSKDTAENRLSSTSMANDDVSGLEALSPVLADFVAEAQKIEQQADYIEHQVVQKSEIATEDARKAEDLKVRMAAARKRMETLIALAKKRSSVPQA